MNERYKFYSQLDELSLYFYYIHQTGTSGRKEPCEYRYKMQAQAQHSEEKVDVQTCCV